MMKFRLLVILLMSLQLVACGYHLRGAVDIPPQMRQVYVEGAGPALRSALNKSFKSSQGELVSSREQAGIVLKVLRDDMRSRVLSLDNLGKATEFEVTYLLVYMLLDNQGKILLEQQELEINRDYFNDQIDILSKRNEELVIQNEMYRQAVRTIVAGARAALTK